MDTADPEDYDDDAVSLNRVMKELNRGARNTINILLLDCCRENELDDTFKGTKSAAGASKGGLGKGFGTPQDSQFFIGLACDPGAVAWADKDARNSHFTAALLSMTVAARKGTAAQKTPLPAELAESNIVKQGNLEKLSSGAVKRWQRRFFTLLENGVLRYADTQDAADATAWYNLKGACLDAFDAVDPCKLSIHAAMGCAIRLKALSAEGAVAWRKELLNILPQLPWELDRLPQSITLEDGERVRRWMRGVVRGDVKDFFPPVLLSYATGRRDGIDAEGTGPGMFYAMWIAQLLQERGVEYFSGLCSKDIEGQEWRAEVKRRYGADDELLFLEEFIDGKALSDLIASGQLYESETDHGEGAVSARLERLFVQLLAALAHVHSCGVLHQDVKPDNIMVNPRTWDISLIDFGVAAIGEGGDGHIKAQMQGDTPSHCSPDQYRLQQLVGTTKDRKKRKQILRDSPLTQQTDLWGAAATCLDMYCGGGSWRRAL
eukprot:g2440.t1